MAGLEQNIRYKTRRTKINNNISKKHKLKTMSGWPVAVHSTILLCHFHAQVLGCELIQLCWTHLRHTAPIHPSKDCEVHTSWLLKGLTFSPRALQTQRFLVRPKVYVVDCERNSICIREREGGGGGGGGGAVTAHTHTHTDRGLTLPPPPPPPPPYKSRNGAQSRHLY